jgi:hypothetical protein
VGKSRITSDRIARARDLNAGPEEIPPGRPRRSVGRDSATDQPPPPFKDVVTDE